jgi:triphosphoribosyl-dephospho-CoA synthase
MTPGQLAQLACILEATARKPGNVHRFADFDDCTYLDFILSAGAIVGPLDRARERGVGAAVLEAVAATGRVVTTNTNLGMILLLAPLAAVPEGEPLRAGVGAVLERLSLDDSRLVYQAIRLARPGGLGDAPAQDVRDEPSIPLREAMRLAADRDSIARQYADGFAEVFDVAVLALDEGLRAGLPLERAIVVGFLKTLAAIPDTLIARKLGPGVAAEASRRAADALATDTIPEYDAWLRALGHDRNPGATADLLAAALFVALRQGTIGLPLSSGSGGWSAP